VEVHTLGIVGAGQMGSGIAQVAAMAGLHVVLSDIDDDALERSLASIATVLERHVGRGRLPAAERDAVLGRIMTSGRLADHAAAQVVVETAVERFDIKAEIFRQLDCRCPPETILASNTSAISITRLGGITSRPDRVVGMHFMNPAPAMRLVEVVRGMDTSDATLAAVSALAERLGKTPVVCDDHPGFVSNRVLMPMVNEAIFALWEGVAEATAIDRIMTLGMNHPMGPLALADLIGLDTCLAVMHNLHEELGEPKYRPCPLLVRMVDAGRLGRKTGRGFFEYDEE
jgi:3-hydroxybutyryl-CoA dehydrogenase